MDRIKIIQDFLDNSPNRLREKYFIKYNYSLYNEIIEFTANLIDIPFKWKVWHWMNNKPNYQLCKCGNRVTTHISLEDGYRKFCSPKCASNDPELRANAKKTLVEKYGVEHYSKTNEWVEKVKTTNLQKYGVDNFSKTDEYKTKSKETYLNKYGVDNFTKTEEYKEKSKKTCLDKYGVDSYTKTAEYKQSFKEKMLEKFGTDALFKSNDWRKENFKISNDEFHIQYLGNSISQFNCDYGLEHTFEINTDNYYGRKHSGNKLCTICNPISSLSSIKEQTVFEFISEFYTEEILRNYKDKYHIDIYLPNINLGFEFNGLYWHSEIYKDRNYHIDKTNYFKEKGVRIVHIWEDDWIHRNEIVKSQIVNMISNTKNKIFARNCLIKEVNNNESKEFLNNNHIQGFVSSVVRIGLFHQGELVSLMTFDELHIS